MLKKLNNAKKLTSVITLMFCCFFLSQAAYAWEKVDGYDVWIDKESITTNTDKASGKTVSIWTIWNLDEPYSRNQKSVKSLMYIECKQRLHGSHNVYTYNELRGHGEKVETTYFEPTPIEPGTLYSSLHNTYCKDWWKVW